MISRNVLENVWNRYRRAAEILKLDKRTILELTSFHDRFSSDITVNIGGEPRSLKLVRVWHRRSLNDKVFKGGMRYHPSVTLSSMESHAAEMTIKAWIHQLPFGGAKGGINIDPNECTPVELELITKEFVNGLNQHRFIGPDIDVLAPDMGTGPLNMLWMAEHFSHLRGQAHQSKFYAYGVVTGKPVFNDPEIDKEIGGIYGRSEATGYGLKVALETMWESGKPYQGKTAVIQGFGNVGSNAAKYLSEMGFQVIAVSDEFGAVHNKNGLDIVALMEYSAKQKPRTVVGFTGGENLEDKDNVLTLVCDVLVPAALEEVITAENADKIHAQVILEGANGPTTPEADKILEERGIEIIPDIYANSGGVVVSFFEWGRNTDQRDSRIPQFNEKSVVLQAMGDMMRVAGEKIKIRRERHKISNRLAAYVLALERTELLRIRRDPNYAAERIR